MTRCNAGQRRVESNNTCAECPKGYYQDEHKHTITDCKAWNPECTDTIDCKDRPCVYEHSEPTASTQRECASTEPCDLETQFQRRAATTSEPRTCQGLTFCADQEYISTAETKITGRVCSRLELCGGGEYTIKEPTKNDKGMFEINRECKPLTTCPAGAFVPNFNDTPEPASWLAGTSPIDRLCKPCSSYKPEDQIVYFQNEENVPRCKKVSFCNQTERMSKKWTATSDLTRSPCRKGTKNVKTTPHRQMECNTSSPTESPTGLPTESPSASPSESSPEPPTELPSSKEPPVQPAIEFMPTDSGGTSTTLLPGPDDDAGATDTGHSTATMIVIVFSVIILFCIIAAVAGAVRLHHSRPHGTKILTNSLQGGSDRSKLDGERVRAATVAGVESMEMLSAILGDSADTVARASVQPDVASGGGMPATRTALDTPMHATIPDHLGAGGAVLLAPSPYEAAMAATTVSERAYEVPSDNPYDTIDAGPPGLPDSATQKNLLEKQFHRASQAHVSASSANVEPYDVVSEPHTVCSHHEGVTPATPLSETRNAVMPTGEGVYAVYSGDETSVTTHPLPDSDAVGGDGEGAAEYVEPVPLAIPETGSRVSTSMLPAVERRHGEEFDIAETLLQNAGASTVC